VALNYRMPGGSRIHRVRVRPAPSHLGFEGRCARTSRSPAHREDRADSGMSGTFAAMPMSCQVREWSSSAEAA
jgi:hypothetical protein